MVPGFINGTLTRRMKGVTKVFVYHFDRQGELLISLVPIRNVVEVEFNLEG